MRAFPVFSAETTRKSKGGPGQPRSTEIFVKDQFTEPEHPQQNPAELCAMKFLKDHSQVLLDQTGAPEDFGCLLVSTLPMSTTYVLMKLSVIRSHVNFDMVDYKTSLPSLNTDFTNASSTLTPINLSHLPKRKQAGGLATLPMLGMP